MKFDSHNIDSKKTCIKEEWKTLWDNKAYLGTWVFLLLLVLVTLKLVCYFLTYNEGRTQGPQLNDFVLNNLAPVDVSTTLFSITWVCIFCCLPFALNTPKKSMVVFISILVISIARSLTLYYVPLAPPAGIIPLRDTLLEGSFYGNTVMVRDLFFSGHTANLALLFFLVDIRWMKTILGIGALAVGFLLLKQHVHYTIDVIAAPFFAYASYKVASIATDKVLKLVLNSAVNNSVKPVIT